MLIILGKLRNIQDGKKFLLYGVGITPQDMRLRTQVGIDMKLFIDVGVVHIDIMSFCGFQIY